MADLPAPPRRPVHLVITTNLRQPARISLTDWLRQRPEFRTAVRDSGRASGGRPGFSDAVIIAVVAQALLPGLFNLLQSWVDQQRTEVNIRVQAGGSEVEVQVAGGRTDPLRLLAEVNRSMQGLDAPAPRPEVGPGPAPEQPAG